MAFRTLLEAFEGLPGAIGSLLGLLGASWGPLGAVYPYLWFSMVFYGFSMVFLWLPNREIRGLQNRFLKISRQRRRGGPGEYHTHPQCWGRCTPWYHSRGPPRALLQTFSRKVVSGRGRVRKIELERERERKLKCFGVLSKCYCASGGAF